MRLGVYGVASTLLAGVTLQHVYTQRGNFYAAGVYLAKSNACLLILLNFGVFLTIVLGKALQSVFFGQLRMVEVEHLYERSWFAITETCLAMTVFRDDFDVPFLAAFAALLFVKIFHWLLQDRVEFMDQAAQLPSSFHARTLTLLTVLWAIDMEFIAYAARVTLRDGVNTWLLFGFEYTILLCTVIAVAGRYALNVVESRMGDETWEEKSVFLFYLELVVDFVKLIAYVSFFTLLVALHGLPLHIIRDLYVTARSFFRRCGDLRRYRRATQDMEQRYPTLTSDDLTSMSDRVCVVCREEMTLPPPIGGNINQNLAEQQQPRPTSRYRLPGDLPKRLPCGHAFHFRCLRSWLERQQSCPTCRRSVLEEGRPQEANMPQAPIQVRAPQVNAGATQPPPPAAAAAAASPPLTRSASTGNVADHSQHASSTHVSATNGHSNTAVNDASIVEPASDSHVLHQSSATTSTMEHGSSSQPTYKVGTHDSLAAHLEAIDIAKQLNLSHDAACALVNELSLLAENDPNPNDAMMARLYRLRSRDTTTNMDGQAGKNRVLASTSYPSSDSPRYGDIIQNSQDGVPLNSFTRLANRMERLEGLLERLLERQQPHQQEQEQEQEQEQQQPQQLPSQLQSHAESQSPSSSMSN